MIKAGANINAKNHVSAFVDPHTLQTDYCDSQDGYTALMVASYLGHSAVVECLLQAKADLNAKAEV